MQSLKISNDELARLTEEVMSLVATYWASVDSRSVYPVMDAQALTKRFSRPWAEKGMGRAVLEDFQDIAAQARVSNGSFFGYVAGSGEPVGALGEMLAATLNQNVTSWRSAPAAVTIERIVIAWLAEGVGCGGFKGNLCGGGSAANLMGLALAREAKLPANDAGVRPGIIYASEQVHMSVPKAVALIGIGRTNLRLIPTDGVKRMRIDALETAIAADRMA